MGYNRNNINRIKSVGENKFPKLKVCGMNENTLDVAGLQPDYLGFIFWKPSKRSFTTDMPDIADGIQKVGVFVDASLNEIAEIIKKYKLNLVQLHGKENPEFCKNLKKRVPEIRIIKVFSIKSDFDFKILKNFEKVCDYFLFDTKGELPGGNGYIFDWKVLKDYPSAKPYFLSGGIGLEEAHDLKEFLKTPASTYCHAIDVNSRFETEPGLKDIEKLKEFKKLLTNK